MNIDRTKSEDVHGGHEYESEIVRAAQSFYCYDLEEKIIDLTGPIQRRAETVRSKPPINWQPYFNLKLIDEDEYTFMTVFQKAKTTKERENFLNDYKLKAFETLIKVVGIVVAEELIKLLVLIDDLLWEDIERIFHFHEAVVNPWKPFLDLLSHKDEFVSNLASRIMTKLIDTPNFDIPDDDVAIFLSWLKGGIKSENEYLLCVARCLQKLLRHDRFRLVFHGMNGIFKIIALLHNGVKPQAQYQFVFCIWVSSYNVEIAEKLDSYNTIQVFVELLMSCPSEIIKLPRVIIATFRNLLEKPRSYKLRKENALLMIQSKVMSLLEAVKIRSKNFDDPELMEDFEVVEETLKKYVAELSTFDEYILEVRSGQLEWSVVHTSKRFWDENADRLNDNDYELLKMLIGLLEMSKDSTVLCVAAHDLGEYMSRYLRGKLLVEQFGGKDALLKLLHYKDPVVKYQALKSLQILMLSNYNLLADFYGDVKLIDLIKRKDFIKRRGI